MFSAAAMLVKSFDLSSKSDIPNFVNTSTNLRAIIYSKHEQKPKKEAMLYSIIENYTQGRVVLFSPLRNLDGIRSVFDPLDVIYQPLSYTSLELNFELKENDLVIIVDYRHKQFFDALNDQSVSVNAITVEGCIIYSEVDPHTYIFCLDYRLLYGFVTPDVYNKIDNRTGTIIVRKLDETIYFYD